MEDLLEDEDEDFDKDDKVITSRQASKKKNICTHTHKLVRARHRRGLTYRKNTHIHKHTDEQNDFFSLPPLSPPLCLAAQTLFAVIARFLATFSFSPVSRKALFPPSFQASVCFFFPLLLRSFLDLCLFFPTCSRIYDTDAVIPAPASCENTRPYKVLS